MNRFTTLLATTAVIGVGASLSGCATEQYVNEQIATVNQRVDAVDAKATDGIRRADAANSAAQAAAASAQQANSAAQAAARSAQAAAADAQRANQRLDTLGPRVDTIEQKMAAPQTGRRPRN